MQHKRVRFVHRTTKTITHTHTIYLILNTSSLVFIHHEGMPYVMSILILHVGLIPSDLVKRFTSALTKTWRICHYNMFSQILRLKKAMSKQTSYCSSEGSDTLHEDLRTSYCWQRHKFAIKSLLWNTQPFYSWRWPVTQQHKQSALLCFHSKK